MLGGEVCCSVLLGKGRQRAQHQAHPEELLWEQPFGRDRGGVPGDGQAPCSGIHRLGSPLRLRRGGRAEAKAG